MFLRLYDSHERADMLEGVWLESQDLAQGVLSGVTTTTDLREAFADCSLIVLLDEIEKKEDETKEDWLKRNFDLFANYAKVTNKRF